MPIGIENDPVAEPPGGSDLLPGAEPFVILKQEVALEVNFREKSVSGVSTIHLFTLNPDLEEITLDARQCEIDTENVTVDGYKTKASFSDPYDLMQVPHQWQLGAPQHHVMRHRMQPLRPKHRPEVPNLDREKLPCCVPADRALRVSLRPEGKLRDEPRRTLKIKTARVDKDLPVDRPDPNDEKNGIKISIPFRSKNIRAGLHFVGVEEGDLRYPHVYTRHSVEPGTASCIFPCVDDPGSRHPWKVSIKCPRTLGDVFEQPLATQSASLQALNVNRKRKAGDAAPAPPLPPASSLSEEDKLMEMTVVCSGNLAGEQIDPQDDKKKIMTFESQLSAAQHIAFAIGPFEHIQLWSEFRTEEADEKLGANAAKIHGYCLPGRAPEVLHTCYPIVAAADYFAPEFGRYPFESYKICFVEDMIPDTSAATSMSLCSTRLLYPEDIQDPEIEVTRKLVHALACQYFGVHIVPNQRSDTWLVVGIQWFMTDLFMKMICGNNWYRDHTKTLSDKLVKLDVGRPSLHDLGEHLYIGDFELEFMSLKAPLVLFILDTRMSKIAGSTGIARIISTIVSNANIATNIPNTSLCQAEFRRTCEKRSSYRPDELWDQYVHSCGLPKLSVKQKFNKKNLNVDITITQTQANENPHREITKEDFFRELEEDIHEVWITPVPKLFTGPFTVRIHEADGTPYEHYLAITDKDKAATALQIAYNTKYKRMKRTKKANAVAVSTSIEKHDIQDDDVVYFNMLGDILQSPKDIENWGLQDWSEATQAQMDQESYEWIRLDCNFEWLCEMITDMPPYMYLAQLQQDRDVVAHQDAMLYWKRNRGGGVLATIETRTAMDRRYYHGIRTMAIEDLPKMADPELNYIGKVHLILIFRHFFCDRIPGKNGGRETYPPAPNDFSDKAQYAVQLALPGAIARTRQNGRCSRDARAFLLDLILFNDNSDNEYSDHFYVAKLLEALTTSVIPEKMDTSGRDLLSSLRVEDDDDDLEFKRFIEKTIEEIDKYRRMDEWTSTYHNIWTTTALNCKMRLMKARVIPTNPLEFVQYLQDDNLDLVRIKAFECLVELGMLSKGPIMKLLMASVSTDPSPFVRDSLFKVLCRGMAAIALGENRAQQAEPEVIVDESGLVIEQGESEIQQRKLDATRNQDVREAIKALKEELKGNAELQAVFWKATESPYISAKEKLHLLDLCYAMFDTDDSLLVTLTYPKYWVATREPAITVGQTSKKQCVVKFSTHCRTRPRNQLIQEAPPPPPPPPPPQLEIKHPEPNKKIKLSSKPSFSGPSASNPPTPLPLPRKESISIPPRAAMAQVVEKPPPSDSIQVQGMARHFTPLKGTPPPAHATSGPSANGIAKPTDKRLKPPVKKRKSDEAEGMDRPPKKLARVENGRLVKMVTVKFKAWNRLPERIQRRIKPAGSTIVATPAPKRSMFGAPRPGSLSRTPSRLASPASSRAPSPGPSKLQSQSSAAPKLRKPLPSSAPSGTATAAPKAPAPDQPKKLIKLKVNKPSQASPPQGPR